jgi:dienelactone hydrolase
MLKSDLSGWLVLTAALMVPMDLTAQSLPGFTLTGEQWSYNPGDGGVVITGILVKPGTNGPRAGVLISHGKGGSATGFSLPKAREMTNWGAVCIGPNYTHAGSATNLPDNEGWCPENSRRARACLTILASLGYVDTNRIGAYGNSMGAFATAGLCGEIGLRIRAAAITAGGTSGTTNVGYAAPATQEVQTMTAPLLMLHGTADTTVFPIQSANLQAILATNAVPNNRVLFDGIGHDLSNNPATEGTVFQLIRDWFSAWGLFGATNSTPGLSLSISNNESLKLAWDRAALRTTIERSTNLNPWLPSIAMVTNRFEWADPTPPEPGGRVFYRIQQFD